MSKRRYRFPLKALAAAMSIACFLSFAGGAVTHAVAAEPWETWPPKKEPPGTGSPTPDAAAKAGEAAGKKTYAGLSAGTWGWIGLGAAVLIGVGIAAGGGGGGTTSTPVH